MPEQVYSQDELPPNIPCIIITKSTGNGAISPSGTILADPSKPIKLSFTPKTGHHVADVKVNNVSKGTVRELTLQDLSSGSIYIVEVKFEINKYSILSIAGEHGSIKPLGMTTVTHGQDIEFTITPDPNYHILDVEVDSESVGAVSKYKFTNVSRGHIIRAYFAQNNFTIKATSGPNGKIEPSGDVLVPYGSSQKFTITPDKYYHIAGIMVDGKPVEIVNEYKFENVTEDHTIHVNFEKDRFTISAEYIGNGKIEPPGDISVEAGTDVELTFIPDEGNHIHDVIVDEKSIGPVNKFVFKQVKTNHSVKVVFELDQYTITSVSEGRGRIEPSDQVKVKRGADQSFVITPAEGYHISDVLVDGTSVGKVNSYTFTNVIAEHSITVIFKPNIFTVKVSATEGGQVIPSEDQTLEYGGSISFRITPNEGYRIEDVIVDGKSMGPLTSHQFLAITKDHVIEAKFTPIKYLIKTEVKGSGSVVPSGIITVDHGKDIVLKFVPNPGNHVADVKVDGRSLGALSEYTINSITKDHSVYVEFEVNKYLIRTFAGRNIKIEPSGDVSVQHGADVKFRFIPKEGCEVGDVIIDGDSKGPLTEYEFKNVTSDHTIYAFIKALKGDINLDDRLGIEDVIIALRISADLLEPNVEQVYLGDMNGDGRIDIEDAKIILRKITGS